MFTDYDFHLYTYDLVYHSVQYFNIMTEIFGTKN
jgi:hypothetical protein